jgi:hypothetical protein
VKFSFAFGIALLAFASGCAAPEISGREKCTVEAIGRETGAGNLKATLYVPETFLTGVEISDGGVMIFHQGCDFPLNAFLSDETANHIIQNAPRKTLTDKKHFVRLVDASLSIWKFSDGSNETRFFVTRVLELGPISKPRSPQDAEHYVVPTNGS